MFSDDMIANKWPLENRSMQFGSLWNPSIFDGINQRKDKKEDRYVLCQNYISTFMKSDVATDSSNNFFVG
jgi:hypothetical protein